MTRHVKKNASIWHIFYVNITHHFYCVQTAHRVDVVFDTYIQNSLKKVLPGRREAKVFKDEWSHAKELERLPTGWWKQNWFLSQEVIHLPTEEDKTIYSTIGTEVLCSLATADVSSIAPCSHKEADTHLFVHVADAVRKGFQKVMVHTVDTDVLVLAIAMFNQIGADELACIWNSIKLLVHTCPWFCCWDGSQNLCNFPHPVSSPSLLDLEALDWKVMLCSSS